MCTWPSNQLANLPSTRSRGTSPICRQPWKCSCRSNVEKILSAIPLDVSIASNPDQSYQTLASRVTTPKASNMRPIFPHVKPANRHRAGMHHNPSPSRRYHSWDFSQRTSGSEGQPPGMRCMQHKGNAGLPRAECK